MTQPIVEAEDIVQTFSNGVRALNGVSLSFEPGIIYGLLGPNGAGKTTLIRVLTTLLRPDSGSARVAGVDVLANPAAARERIGLAGQYAAVDEYQTGRENIIMVGRLYNLSSREARSRADEILERIHLTDAANRPVKTYSGGMRRRLDLAASVVGRPQVLFLDEPTTGIDPRSRQDLWELITDLVDDGTTLLLTTQYLEEADRLATRIGVIDEGDLIAEGTPNELKDRIGGDVIELHLANDQLATAAAALATMAGEEPKIDLMRHSVTIPAPQAARTLVEAVRQLDQSGLDIHDVALRRPTLDDVFLTLTGHRAETTPAPAPSERGRRGRRRRADRS
ncbi:MAG: ATP-binding cassette domain-containing protein [Acidimicrobiia bacterium]|nr:ATP-binding cassette domain-containing protein [Acidimicrobiia bacterium]